MDGKDYPIILLGIVVLVITIIFNLVIVVPLIFPQQESEFPQQENGFQQLEVGLETLSGKALESVPLDIKITNNGDIASNVRVILSSDAFGELTTNPIDVPANGTVSPPYIEAIIRDIPNKNYQLTISYSFDNMDYSPSNTTKTFYVIPNLKLVDVLYPRESVYLPEKDTIEQHGNTKLDFKVESNSKTSTYDRLSAGISCLQSGQNLEISPLEIPIEVIGPQGKTENQYIFKIEGNNSPVGTYTLKIVLYCDGYEVAIKTRTLYIQ